MGPPGIQEKLGIGLNPPVLFCFILVSVSLPGTDPVEVKVSDSPVKVLRDQDGFIPCTITGYSSAELDLQRLSVHWTLGSGPVYMYDRGSHNPIRPGSELDIRLIKGNAGLSLARVQITDEGEYTCAVTYDNERAEGRSALEVAVKPSASLVPPDVIIEEGTEGGVTCRASNYYPETIKFQWIKHLNDGEHVVLRRGVSTNEPLENGDGTFTVTSQLLLKPSMGDDGGKYSCVISHRSLGDSLVLDFILSVKESHVLMIRAVIGTLAALILPLCIWGYKTLVRNEPPRLSPITGSQYLLHMKKATMFFQISGFRPKPIHISIHLKRKWGESTEIYSWNSEAQTGSSAPRNSDGSDTAEMVPLVRDGDGHNLPPLQLQVVPDVKSSKRGIYSCQCTMYITPDMHEDDGAELTVRVNHMTLISPISVSCRLKVLKEPPKPSPIGGAERLVHLRKSTLRCRIPGSLPEPTEITLYLQRKGEEQIEILSWKPGGKALPFTAVSQSAEGQVANKAKTEQEVSNGNSASLPPAQRPLRVEMVPVITTSTNGDSNCQCIIHITPDIEEDDGAELTVRVTHSELREPYSVSCRLEVNEETMLLVMDEDYTVRVAPPPRDPTDNFHTRAITLGRLEGLDNIALSPTGKLFAIREGNLYTGPVSSCINQILFSLDRRIGRGAWDMFKLFSVDPRGLLCAVGDSGSVYWGPRPEDESQNWVGDLGEYVGNYNCSDTDSIVFDPQGALYAITSNGRIQMWVRPAETDSDWLDLGTALSQRDGRDSPHVISFCPEGNLWWVSKADGKLYKGPQPTQGNPGYWEKATFLGPDYHRYRLFGFIGATFIQKIQSFEFLPELGKIVKERNIIVNTETYNNSTGGTTLNGTYSFKETIKEVSRFIHDHNIVFVGEAETTFTGGIPVIGMERASRISLDNNVTHRWDFTNTNEREVTLSLQEAVAVGSGKTVRMGASVQKAKVRVPYRVRLLTAQGRTVTIGGSWEGTTFYKLRAVPREARGRGRKKRSYPKLPPEDIWKEESCYDSMYRDRWDRDSDISSNERFLPRRRVTKEPPKPSPIGGAERLVHLRKSTLSCRIPGSLPEPTEITLYLQRKGKEQIEILSWKPGEKPLPFTAVSQSAEGHLAVEPEREGLVGNGETNLPPAQRALRVEMVPVITTSKNGDFNCQCTIHITPDIEEDDGAELTVRVTHSALRGPISKSCRLEVNEETMLLVMDEDYTVRVAPPPRDPTDNFHTRAITLGRLEGLDNIALSPTGKLFAIREGNLYTGPVLSCVNQILFSLDRRIGCGAWDVFKLFSVDPRGLLCAVGDSGSLYWGPRPEDESQNWVGDLGEYVGNYNCSDTDSIVFDPQGALYAITSDGRIQMWVRPAETDSDWLDLGTALSQRDGRDSPHVISFCPEGNLWWVSKADGKLYKGPQPTQGNPGYWEKATFLGPDYHRYRLFGFIGATFIQKIQDFEFLPELGEIVTERNMILMEETYDNGDGGGTLNETFSFRKSIKEVSRFIHDHNIVFVGEAETTFTGGIPVIGMERASRISLDNNVTHRWDFTNTNEREVTLSLQEPVVVGSGKTVRMGASVQKARISVAYRVRLLTAQGRTVTIGGSWEGTTFYNLRAVPREARGRGKHLGFTRTDSWEEETHSNYSD
ncbi:uncharacterized protein LOC100498645 isoform X1 [Xenopus tropicalis]|uniref:Uncharacterized protein LOC100498645 isoform X1 n=3 Tax=Xenopus tropicalis TaxID=8364 RepID=A0A8J1JGR4_XENTR|nr:uncharacterized protein LOC100498645 isoform X1 [Xenopus tropicalis]